MPNAAPDKSAPQIRAMFGSIAGTYDLLNHLLTGWQDIRWRRAAARLSGAKPGDCVLDACCGSGDLTLSLHRQMEGRGTLIGSDFTREMLVIARRKGLKQNDSSGVSEGQQTHSSADGARSALWVQGDTLRLPFADGQFDVCTVGWGIRNVENLAAGLREIRRVLKTGGRAVILESTQPKGVLFPRLFRFYFSRVMPLIGNGISRTRAYSYLQASVYDFPDAETLRDIMLGCGYARVEFQRLTFGTIAIHSGQK